MEPVVTDVETVRVIPVASDTSSWVRHLHHDHSRNGFTKCTAEFDFRVVGDGRSAIARYANNSNYRNDSLIRKESMCHLTP